MNKSYACNKSSIKFIVNLFACTLLFFLTISILINTSKFNFKTVIILFISYLITILLFAYIYYLFLKKSKNILIINNDYIIHKTKDNEIKIKILEIMDIDSREDVIVLKRNININYFKKWEQKYSFSISKSLIKKIEKDLNIEIKYVGNARNKSLKTRFVYWIKDNLLKKKILYALLGLIQTIISILIYVKYKSTIITIILLTLCSLFAFYQVIKFYFTDKTWDTYVKISMSILSFVIYIVIVFIAVTLFSLLILKLKFSYVYLIYAVMTSPSFLIVIAILALLLYSLSYV